MPLPSYPTPKERHSLATRLPPYALPAASPSPSSARTCGRAHAAKDQGTVRRIHHAVVQERKGADPQEAGRP